MTTETTNKLVYDLTIEYVKQTKLLNCHQDSLTNKISDIAKISESINDAVMKNIDKFKL